MLQNLRVFACGGNQLTNLDTSMLNDLFSLTCSDNQLVELKLSPHIATLVCENNQLSSLDISSLTNNPGTIMCDNLKIVYLSSSQKSLRNKFSLWGEYDIWGVTYPEPSHYNGYQYPEFIYK